MSTWERLHEALDGWECAQPVERRVLDPERGPDGLFVQPNDIGPDRERDEQHNRDRFANHFKYADPFTGNTRTFDAVGDYNCGRCNQTVGTDCLLLKIPAVDRDVGSCAHWENTCAGDAEMVLHLIPPDVASYAIAANGEGWGCHRCPYASPAHAPDSRGRNLYCGKMDARVFWNACCAINGAEAVPLGKDGMPRHQGPSPMQGGQDTTIISPMSLLRMR